MHKENRYSFENKVKGNESKIKELQKQCKEYRKEIKHISEQIVLTESEADFQEHASKQLKIEMNAIKEKMKKREDEVRKINEELFRQRCSIETELVCLFVHQKLVLCDVYLLNLTISLLLLDFFVQRGNY